MYDWFINVMIAMDQLFLNAFPSLILNMMPGVKHKFGNPDETMSSVLGKNIGSCKVCSMVCKILAMMDNKHCIEAIEEDECDDQCGV